MRAALFTDWTSWDGIDSILPLVHRPAHYHSLLICLAAINLLLRPERSRRDWVLAGLLLGLMAGFNFTLAATFGVAAVLGGVILFLQRRQSDARDLAWLALFIFLGSLPVTAGMLLAGFHNTAPGFPFRGPNLQFSTAAWGTSLSRIMPCGARPMGFADRVSNPRLRDQVIWARPRWRGSISAKLAIAPWPWCSPSPSPCRL